MLYILHIYRNCLDVRVMFEENASFTHAKAIKASTKQKIN